LQKKGYHHQLNKQHVLILHQYKGQPWSVTLYHWFIDWSKVNHNTYICNIRHTHLDYIGLYYRILNEILACDYIRSFVGFFSSSFSSIVNLHSPGSDVRPISKSEREREYREAKIKLQLTHVLVKALYRSDFFLLHDHHIKFVFRRHRHHSLLLFHSLLESSMSILVFCFGRCIILLRFLSIYFSSLLFFYIIIILSALSVTTRQHS
jgi:hypothetical protein